MKKLNLSLVMLAGFMFTLPLYAKAIAETGDIANSAAVISDGAPHNDAQITPDNAANSTDNKVDNTADTSGNNADAMNADTVNGASTSGQ